MRDKKFVLTGVSDFHHLGDGVMNVWADQASDDYHSMDDLYRHRMVLTAALLNSIDIGKVWGVFGTIQPWKSKQHSDGTMFEGGYFIVGAQTPQGQISYHYKLEHWDLFQVPELDRAPEYDGHTADDVVERLSRL